MTYISTINTQTYRIDPDENGAQRTITLDGRTHTIDWRHIAPLAAATKGQVNAGGRYSLIIEGDSYEVFARRITKADEKDSETYEILVAGQRFEVKVEDERAKLLAGLVKSATITGEAKVQAPMPGLVIGVPLEEGAAVKQGQTVIVLEARITLAAEESERLQALAALEPLLARELIHVRADPGPEGDSHDAVR